MRAIALFALLCWCCSVCVACKGGERCKAWAGSTGGATFFQCGDGRERTVRCDKAMSCKCAIDGVTESTFVTQDIAPFDTRDGAIALANAKCGWHTTK